MLFWRGLLAVVLRAWLAVFCTMLAPAVLAGGVDVVLVLDNSGSMRSSDPDHLANRGLLDFVNRLPRDSRIGVVVYDHRVRMLAPLAPKPLFDLDSVLGDLDYSGQWTRTAEAVARAKSALEEAAIGADADDAPHLRRIVLMTDGPEENPDRSVNRERARWMRGELAQTLSQEKVSVSVVALGPMVDIQSLQTLAQKTGGHYVHAEDAFSLGAAFDSLRLDRPTQDLAVPVEAVAASVPVAASTAVGSTRDVVDSPFSRSLPAAADSSKPIEPESVGKASQLGVVGDLEPAEDVEGGLGARALDDVASVKADSANATPAEGVDSGQGVLSIAESEGAGSQDGSDAVATVASSQRDAEEALESESHGTWLWLALFAGLLLLGWIAWLWRRRARGCSDVAVPAAGDVWDGESAEEEGGEADEPVLVLDDLEQVSGLSSVRLVGNLLSVGRVRGDAPRRSALVLEESTVSRRHASIEFRDGAFWLRDLGSANGTRLNGQRLDQSKPLYQGDELCFDELCFKVKQGGLPKMDATMMASSSEAMGDADQTVVRLSDDVASASLDPMAQTMCADKDDEQLKAVQEAAEGEADSDLDLEGTMVFSDSVIARARDQKTQREQVTKLEPRSEDFGEETVIFDESSLEDDRK